MTYETHYLGGFRILGQRYGFIGFNLCCNDIHQKNCTSATWKWSTLSRYCCEFEIRKNQNWRPAGCMQQGQKHTWLLCAYNFRALLRVTYSNFNKHVTMHIDIWWPQSKAGWTWHKSSSHHKSDNRRAWSQGNRRPKPLKNCLALRCYNMDRYNHWSQLTAAERILIRITGQLAQEICHWPWWLLLRQ